MEKGLITKEEFARALAVGMEREAKDYERRLTELMGSAVTLL